MSIILKGIDLPEKENQMYMMELYADGHCSVAKIEDGECYELTIPSETEAIQIPEGHGRLIDADELVKHLRKDPLFDLVERYGISGVIESRPTILGEERE